ncbi:MAG: electron transport complex subunit RsxC [Ruminococcaceae bacterium]|nr:electron transport complex subunit RsxC [Oscillospiraceae bacterium]
MGKLTCKRGIHPHDYKEQTKDKAIRKLPAPKLLYFPLQQHIGKPAEPVVKPGDSVLMGQVIADTAGMMTAPVHASVSGIVQDIGQYLHPNGTKQTMIVIENDGLDTPAEPLVHRSLHNMTQDEIIGIIRDAGIVGMGGAGFPTHVKLSPPADKPIDYVIVNGAECEPYLTSDHRVMVEMPDDIIKGLSVLMHLFPKASAHIAVEDNKPDAIEALTRAAEEQAGIRVETLKTKYPQGSEKQLISAVTGREVPSGGLPMDVGCLVLNIDTVLSIAKAVLEGKPLYERVVTVSGHAVCEPGNFLVRMGTPFSHIVEAAGGVLEPLGKILMGGPMMGTACYSLDVPVVKGTSALLLMTAEEANTGKESPCIRCGRCVSACPIGLRPLFLNAYIQKENWELCHKENIRDCIECGSCSYVCPAKRHLVQSIRLGKDCMKRAGKF